MEAFLRPCFRQNGFPWPDTGAALREYKSAEGSHGLFWNIRWMLCRIDKFLIIVMHINPFVFVFSLLRRTSPALLQIAHLMQWHSVRTQMLGPYQAIQTLRQQWWLSRISMDVSRHWSCMRTPPVSNQWYCPSWVYRWVPCVSPIYFLCALEENIV